MFGEIVFFLYLCSQIGLIIVNWYESVCFSRSRCSICGHGPAAREYILNTIINYHAPDATVIISTHLIRDVEEILDGFVFVGGGGILMSGDVNEVRREHGKSLDEIFREVFRCY